MRGCTQCGECLAVCPVFRLMGREEYAPKAKRLLLEDEQALPWQAVFRLSRLCAGCGRCRDVCARRLSACDLLAECRAAHPHWKQHFWRLWMGRAGRFWPLAARMASLWPAQCTPAPLRASLAAATAMVPQAVTPWQRLEPAGALTDEERTRPVRLFAGCTSRNVRPAWAAKAQALLERWGYTVLPDEGFTCCGETLHHAGELAAQSAVRARNVASWRASGRPALAVFCASCRHALAAYAEVEGLFTDSERTLWRDSVHSLAELLVQPRLEHDGSGPAEPPMYHQPCHARHGDPDEVLLRTLWPQLRRGTGICCGLGGILQLTDPNLSARLGAACHAGFGETSHVLTACGGCALQLAATAPNTRQVLHWLDVVETDI